MMVLGAGRGDRLLPALSAGLFRFSRGRHRARHQCAVVVQSHGRTEGPNLVKSALRCNVWLAALIYAWGASAMFGMYSLSDLVWRHAFQYAGGASIFAAGIALYGFSLGRAKGAGIPPIVLTALHGLAAAGGLIYLIGADKLFDAEVGLGGQRGLPLGRHRRRGDLRHVGAHSVARHSFLNCSPALFEETPPCLPSGRASRTARGSVRRS